MSISSNRQKFGKQQRLQAIRYISWVVNLIFFLALVWAIYQAAVNGKPLPVWAWIGMVVLLAAVIGLGVGVVVYQGVVKEVGPFDFRPSGRVAGELKRVEQRVESAGAASLRAEIKMMSGVLQVAGGAAEVMQASFEYDDADWKPPQVEYGVDARGQGKLVVEQKGTGRPAMRQGSSEWDVRLSRDLPTDLNIKFGAGKADLRLGGMALDRLRVESGVGELSLDLSGEWSRSPAVLIKAGIGDTMLRLPQNAGVRIHSTVGLGSVHSNGLRWDGEAYTNRLYGQTATNLDITIEGGMGKIILA